MKLAAEDEEFLKALVKSARQRTHQVKWSDRDGTQRLSMLTTAEVGQLNSCARHLKLNPADTLRQTAYIPVSKPAPKLPDEGGDAVQDSGNG